MKNLTGIVCDVWDTADVKLSSDGMVTLSDSVDGVETEGESLSGRAWL